MNRRDFVTKLLGVSAAVCVGKEALGAESAVNDSIVRNPRMIIVDDMLSYGMSMYDSSIQGYQEAASREMAKQFDREIFRRYTR